MGPKQQVLASLEKKVTNWDKAVHDFATDSVVLWTAKDEEFFFIFIF